MGGGGGGGSSSGSGSTKRYNVICKYFTYSQSRQKAQ